MKIKLKIFNVKPVSVNSAYYKYNKQYNEKARNYREDFLDGLQSDYNQAQLKKLPKFAPKKHFLALSWTFFIPKPAFFTKAGHISRKSMDLDNILKLPIDFLCNKKYVERGYNNLQIDDQFIADLVAKKRASIDGNYYIHIDIEIKLLSTI